ncbi:c-type cytochrome [Pseudomonas kielensis]|jgi:cytochrome c5|uniref:c-type cytochrome n=1 Tax=Pseudomonas kielensis TaxID=2762577 RepID=UPI00223F6AAC|nr:c-type cytochrome [Pseudomonas kielensis]UZM14791.1 c-type cytochrome [Pseudomonas kielensis]WKL53150.1 c-type cytochrome [Pseudomonas kielensis]
MWALIRAGWRFSCRGAALALVLGVLGGCGEEPKDGPDRAAAAASMPADAGLARTYDTSCKLCHANPASGAPLTGDQVAWRPRLQQGMDSLLDHTINGHNGMPPMGMCMQCSEDDFLALISFMSGQHLQ